MRDAALGAGEMRLEIRRALRRAEKPFSDLHTSVS